MLMSVVCWRWPDAQGKHLFGVEYVNRLRSMLARNLRLPHQVWCITDDTKGIDGAVRCIPQPAEYANTPRCRRRMWQYAKDRTALFGPRMLAIDLDVVITADITSLIDRTEALVMWRVGYADVLSGSIVLCDTGALDGAWQAYRNDPDGYPLATGEKNGSDQAMLNHYIKTNRLPVAEWTERDGIRSWFGRGYGMHEHHGLSSKKPELPRGTRMVVFGSSDKAVMDRALYPWITECWR